MMMKYNHVSMCGMYVKLTVMTLQVLEMWLWRRMERVSWKDKKINIEVLALVKDERSMLSTITRRKKNWMGHILRGQSLLIDVMEGEDGG